MKLNEKYIWNVHRTRVDIFIIYGLVSIVYCLLPFAYGSKAAGRKKVLEMSVTNLHYESSPVQTIRPTDLGLLPS